MHKQLSGLIYMTFAAKYKEPVHSRGHKVEFLKIVRSIFLKEIINHAKRVIRRGIKSALLYDILLRGSQNLMVLS